MPKLRLTTAAVERLKPPEVGQVEYFDAALPAFGLRLSYSGSRAWIVMTRVDGKLIRVTLGRYPTISLADAREKAREVMALAQAGRDPRHIEAEARRRREAERRATFEVVASRFMERHVGRGLRPSTAREYRRILQGPDTADWRSRPIASITKGDVVEVLQRIESRGAPAAANRALAYFSKFFNWCVEEELVLVSPAARVRALTPVTSRERVLSADELRWIWTGMQAYEGLFGALFKILLLTGQRRGEVAGMRWDELRDLDGSAPVWEIPSQRTKNKQPHLVPLAPMVRDIIIAQPRTGPLVFTTTSATSVSGFSKAKARLDAIVTNMRQGQGLPPLAPWTLHDLRRTMVTVMNEKLGIAPHVVEAVVNHLSGAAKAGVAGVYNRALYLDDRRKALHAWAQYVMANKASA